MLSDKNNKQPYPGNNGRLCIFNGSHLDKNGKAVECRCDECSYLMCCLDNFSESDCYSCKELNCPCFPKQP